MKKIIGLLLIAILLTACHKGVETQVPTHVIVDDLGREVAVPIEVEKVGCIYAISGHITAMLGEGDKIVSVTSGLKRDVMLNALVPTLKDATEPKRGGSINIEELLKNKPDVIFVHSDIALNEAETDKLDKFHIPYLAIEFDSIAAQQDTVRMIAKVYGKEEKAEAYIAYCNEKIGEISQNASEIDQRIRVFHSINEATRTDPKGSIAAEWFTKSGFELVSASEDLKFISGDYYASLEQILKWNPEAIFVNEDGVDDYIMTDEKWRSLDAVKSGQVFMLPVGISRWGHPNSLEIPLAMMFTVKKMYPQYFEDLDIASEMTYFYKTFFDLDMDDEMIQEILRGEGMRIRKDQK